MTFIASVIAKKGVAIIADSFVTSELPTLYRSDFNRFLATKIDGEGHDNINFSKEDIFELFQYQRSHTKDFEEKLIRFDKYTAITTTGAAAINNKRISDLVGDFLKQHEEEQLNALPIQEKVNLLCDFVTQEIITQLQNHEEISTCLFVFTHFDASDNSTKIYVARVKRTTEDALVEEGYEFINVTTEPDFKKVVTYGQTKTAEKILYGSLINFMTSGLPSLIRRINESLGKPCDEYTDEFIMQYTQKDEAIRQMIQDELELFKLSELSLQQAVNLASLLMKLEVDFQTYTENIPTVGGVIKLAVIDKDGFKFISGHEIQKPKNI
ncbi:MAG TPA: hypothetical protein VGE25_09790 [Sediminibacterium sp.]|nr:hypothetical protein [Bacteroidota bacterium]